MECRAIGFAPSEREKDLEQLLTGLSQSRPRSFECKELVLNCRLPNRDDLYLRHTKETNTWTAVHYAPPLRGKSYTLLPATVRSITAAPCRGPDVVAFYQDLGFELHHQSIRMGRWYQVPLSGHDIVVTVSKLYRVAEDGRSPGDQVAPHYVLIEAATLVEEGKEIPAAEAVGDLASLLQRHAVLRPFPQKSARKRPLPQ